MAQSTDTTDVVDLKQSRLSPESFKNITSDPLILSDRKQPADQNFKISIKHSYDVII